MINFKTIAYYLLCAILCLISFYILADMKQADPSVPLYYNLDKDYTAHQTFFWNFSETGSATIAPRLGAPDQSDSRRFPIDSVDRFEWIIIGFLKLFSTDFVFLINTFYILTFLFSSLVATFAFRVLGINNAGALAGGLLFAFQPYHWFQSVGHIFISSYFMVPLLCVITIWLTMQDNDHFIFWKQKHPESAHETRSWKTLFSVQFCPFQNRAMLASVTIVLASGTGSMYYLLMSSVLWCFVAARAFAIRPYINRIYDVVSLVGISLCACILQLLPTFQYISQNQIPPLKRSADVTGFDLFWSFFPSIGHRSMLLRKFVSFGRYYNQPEDQIFYALGEKAFSALGFIGAAGLCMILIAAWLRPPETGRLKILKNLSTIVLIGIFLATTNGINRVIAYIPSFPIRAWNRFSICLAFFALLAVLSFYEEIQDRLRSRSSNWISRLLAGLLGLITLFGLWDQSPSIWIPDHKTASQRWHSDQRFISELESGLPANAMIFNLPLSSYPEGIGHTKSHLASKSLRWSFGAYGEGEYLSDSALWQKEIMKLSGPEIVDVLRKKGFSGILVEDDPQMSMVLNRDNKERIDTLDLELRFRLVGIETLKESEAKFIAAGLKPSLVNDRGDWRYYAIPLEPKNQNSNSN